MSAGPCYGSIPSLVHGISRPHRCEHFRRLHTELRLGKPVHTLSFCDLPLVRNCTADAEQVKRGGCVLSSCIKIIRGCWRCHVPWIVEHPHRCFMLNVLEFRDVFRFESSYQTCADQCDHGGNCKKPSFMGPCMDLERISRKCRGKRNVCTGCATSDVNGRTYVAQPKLRALNRSLAHRIVAHTRIASLSSTTM